MKTLLYKERVPFKDTDCVKKFQGGSNQLKFKMELFGNLGHRKATKGKLVLPASDSLLKAHTRATVGDYFTRSETWPSSGTCHCCSLLLCNHGNYSKPRERPPWPHNLLFCSYFWDTRAKTPVRNKERCCSSGLKIILGLVITCFLNLDMSVNRSLITIHL